MDIKSLRQEAGALLALADEKVTEGDAEQAEKMLVDAQTKMEQAEALHQAQSKAKQLSGEFNKIGRAHV